MPWWRNGRREGLKIPWTAKSVCVQLTSTVLNKNNSIVKATGRGKQSEIRCI